MEDEASANQPLLGGLCTSLQQPRAGRRGAPGVAAQELGHAALAEDETGAVRVSASQTRTLGPQLTAGVA